MKLPASRELHSGGRFQEMTRILIFDDSSFMRQYLRGFLEEAGHEVDDFLPGSALEALDRVKAFRPELVISDYNMPLVDGQAIARALRHADPGLRIMILTAIRNPARESLLGTIGVRRILHKPISGGDLVQAVKEVMESG